MNKPSKAFGGDILSKSSDWQSVVMDGLRLQTSDEEDVALSAMNSFCRMARNRQTPIADSSELWKLLSTIVKRKVNKERQRQFAAKRQEYRLLGESKVLPMRSGDEKENQNGLAQLPGHEPSPELAAELAETLQRILDLPEAENIVLLKYDGYSNSEIAKIMGCSTRTVQRAIEKIKKEWENWQIKAEDEWKKF